MDSVKAMTCCHNLSLGPQFCHCKRFVAVAGALASDATSRAHLWLCSDQPDGVFVPAASSVAVQMQK